MLEKFIKATWGKDEFWHIRPEDVNTIHAAGKEIGFGVTQILPKTFPPREKSEGLQPKAGTAAQGESPSTVTGKEAVPLKRASGTTIPKTPDVGPQLVAGIIEQATPQAGKSPRLYVLLRMPSSKTAVAMTAWDTAHFPPLIAGKGKQCELLVKRNASKDGKAIFTNIVALRRIGTTEYDTDGKTPIIQQKTREAGSAGNLFQP